MTTPDDTADRTEEKHRLDSQGRRIDICYQPHSFAGCAHLQIRVRHCRPLPITETGYRSHFASRLDIEELGGPAAYVEAWLNAAAQSKAWRRVMQSGLQLNLL